MADSSDMESSELGLEKEEHVVKNTTCVRKMLTVAVVIGHLVRDVLLARTKDVLQFNIHHAQQKDVSVMFTLTVVVALIKALDVRDIHMERGVFILDPSNSAFMKN